MNKTLPPRYAKAVYVKSRLTDILDKYLSSTTELINIKKFILHTDVEFTEEKYNFLPGWTVISNCHKPHHLDPYVRNLEEELFILHDALHQLFPMYTTPRMSGREFIDSYTYQQIIGEYYVFCITEYFVQKEMLKHCSDKYKDYILNIRGYYTMLESLFKNYLDKAKPIASLVAALYDGNTNKIDGEYIETFNKVKNMFDEDRFNSKSNFEHLDCLLNGVSRNSILHNHTTITPLDHDMIFKAIKNGGVSGAWNLHKNPNIKKQIPEWI
jgi:hypothetical protein